MERFNIFNRVRDITSSGGGSSSSSSNGGNRHSSAANDGHDDNHASDPYDGRAPLSPRITPDDLEAQPTPAAARASAAATVEMAERGTPATRFLHRFRPAIPSFFSVAAPSTTSGSSSSSNNSTSRAARVTGTAAPRPSSSRYSGEGIGGAPDTVVGAGDMPDNDNNYYDDDDDDDYDANGYSYDEEAALDSPKTPPCYQIGAPDLPSTRLHIPNLERTWSAGSNGPPTRPGTAAAAAAADIAQPRPVVQAGHAQGRTRTHESVSAGVSSEDRDEGRRRRRRRRRRRDWSGGERSHMSGRSERSGRRSERSRGERERGRLEDGQRARRRRGGGRGAHRGGERRQGQGQGRRPPPPKRFLFCFPWVKSRRIRTQILRCFVSGIFLALILAVCKLEKRHVPLRGCARCATQVQAGGRKQQQH